MNLDNIYVSEGDATIKFSDKDVWAEEVSFAAFLNAIIEFVKKLLKFEFDF